MPRKKHSVDQIIGKLRQAEVELSKGETVRVVVRKLGSPSRRTTAGARSTAA